MPETPARIFRGRVADQIVEDLRGQILDGTLPDGSRLPSERELAAYYDVSGPTIREAIRVLTAMGLVNTRNGSRAVITAQGDTLLAVSIASLVQVEKVSGSEVFGLLGALNAYAAELAATQASDQEVTRLREASHAIPASEGVAPTATALREFFNTLATISHNPLLAALCRFITEMQIELAVKLAESDNRDFVQVVNSLHTERMRIVAAIASRDPQHAAAMVRNYHRLTVEQIVEARKAAGDSPVSGTGLTEALTTWLRTNVTLSGQATSPRGSLP
ncbi:FadR/GntR family transcriptional regulator [Streptomyces sp. NPDC088794]|uniref:FadR/GntR family transcriptional regulator n=1 Tax=Streptomyces sp. NPDC088794 TaxID=3365902 RepID=UPI003805B43A